MSKLKMASKNAFRSLRGKETIFIISRVLGFKTMYFKSINLLIPLEAQVFSQSLAKYPCRFTCLHYTSFIVFMSLTLRKDLTLLGLNCTILAIPSNRAMWTTCQDRSTKGIRTLTSNIGQWLLLCSVLQQYQRTWASRTAVSRYHCKSINWYYSLWGKKWGSNCDPVMCPSSPVLPRGALGIMELYYFAS